MAAAKDRQYRTSAQNFPEENVRRNFRLFFRSVQVVRGIFLIRATLWKFASIFMPNYCNKRQKWRKCQTSCRILHALVQTRFDPHATKMLLNGGHCHANSS